MLTGVVNLQGNYLMGSKPHRSFGVLDFAWRWALAIVLVFATFNPSGHSYYHWIAEAFSAEGSGLGALHYFLGVVLITGWTIYLVATQGSLGTAGIVILAALIGTGIWLLVDVGIINADSTRAITWLALVALATLLAVGMSWSHIWRRLSGQIDVDEVDG